MPLRVSFKWAVLHQLNLKGFALTKQQSKANWETSILFQDVGGVFWVKKMSTSFQREFWGFCSIQKRIGGSLKKSSLEADRPNIYVAETLIQYRSPLLAEAAAWFVSITWVGLYCNP